MLRESEIWIISAFSCDSCGLSAGEFDYTSGDLRVRPGFEHNQGQESIQQSCISLKGSPHFVADCVRVTIYLMVVK